MGGLSASEYLGWQLTKPIRSVKIVILVTGMLMWEGGTVVSMDRQHENSGMKSEYGEEHRDQFDEYEWIYAPDHRPQPGSGESVHCQGDSIGEWQEPESLY